MSHLNVVQANIEKYCFHVVMGDFVACRSKSGCFSGRSRKTSRSDIYFLLHVITNHYNYFRYRFNNLSHVFQNTNKICNYIFFSFFSCKTKKSHEFWLQL